mmetsp:Transcript_35628/g.70843  ORF Transcript_35628/g.70843 Transcript_35628/m.70843 type:complete len:449 (-) Transcript_35628:291-1637(-)
MGQGLGGRIALLRVALQHPREEALDVAVQVRELGVAFDVEGRGDQLAHVRAASFIRILNEHLGHRLDDTPLDRVVPEEQVREVDPDRPGVVRGASRRAIGHLGCLIHGIGDVAGRVRQGLASDARAPPEVWRPVLELAHRPEAGDHRAQRVRRLQLVDADVLRRQAGVQQALLLHSAEALQDVGQEAQTCVQGNVQARRVPHVRARSLDHSHKLAEEGLRQDESHPLAVDDFIIGNDVPRIEAGRGIVRRGVLQAPHIVAEPSLTVRVGELRGQDFEGNFCVRVRRQPRREQLAACARANVPVLATLGLVVYGARLQFAGPFPWHQDRLVLEVLHRDAFEARPELRRRAARLRLRLRRLPARPWLRLGWGAVGPLLRRLPPCWPTTRVRLLARLAHFASIGAASATGVGLRQRRISVPGLFAIGRKKVRRVFDEGIEGGVEVGVDGGK